MRVPGNSLPLPNVDLARPVHGGGRPWRFLDAVVALSLVAVVAIAALNPNREWMKRHVHAFLLSRSGLDVDYGWVHIHPLSGIEISDFTVRAAPEFRELTPNLLRASHFDVGWTVSSLLGDGPRLERIALSDVDVAVVVDEHNRTSLDTILPSPGPLSHRAEQLLASVPITGQLDITRADVEIVWTQASRVLERDRIRGIGATLVAEPAGEKWRVRADAGSITRPLDVRLTLERFDGFPPREAKTDVSLSTVLTTSALEASLDLKLREQSVSRGIELGNWHADAIARFDSSLGRTTVALERVITPAGALTFESSIELPDDGVPILRHAQGNIYVTHLLGWIPAGVVPFTADSGLLQFEVESASLERPPRLLAGGRVHVDADLTNARLHTSAGTIDIGRSRSVLDVRPTSGPRVTLHGSQHVDAARAEFRGVHVDIGDLAIDVDADRAEDGAISGRLGLRFGRLQQRAGAVSTMMRYGECQVHLDDLYPSASEDRGAHAGAIDASASGVLQVVDAGRRLIAGSPAKARLELRDVFPDTRFPLASRGTGRASLDVDGNSLALEAAKRADAIDYVLRVAAPSLKALRPFLPPAFVEAADWDAMAVDLRSNGHIERIDGQPRLRQNTSVDIDRPALRGLSARKLSLTMHSEGTASRHLANASLRVSALTLDGTPAGDDELALSLSRDRNAASVHLKASAAGHREAQVEVSAAFDGESRAVVYDANGRFSGLAQLAPLIARVHGLGGLDLSRLEVAVAARGKLLGVLSGLGSDGAVLLEPNPWGTAALEGVADIRVANARWTRPGLVLDVPAAAWHGDMHSEGDVRVLAMHADITSLRLGLGPHQIDLAGISDDTTAKVTGDLLDPEVELTQEAAIRTVEQDLASAYPTTTATIALSLRREPQGLVRVSNLHVLDSAGTTLDLRGGIDFGARRSRKLSMVADIVQDLQPLSSLPARFSGRGVVKVAATIESPDLSFFRTRLDVTAAGVELRIPSVGVEAQSVDAEIPVQLDFDVDDDGARVRRDGHNRYAMLRFGDQHPFLKRSGFVSIRRLTTPQLEIAPFVGNLAIKQNVISLGQFEMGVRGGRLAGECALDWDGPRSSLVAHLRATGVRSTHDELLDGNMAVVVSASDRGIEGRAEILRIGKRHLLDLLDVQDPLRVDPAMNRIRSALAYGYPSRLHIAFNSGFARARVELGGLARFMSIDELHGIPTGPLVDRLVKAVFEEKVRP